ncbi:MAG: type II toxin-antitoxin system VapC family toxin [Variibacter sp.]|nr:type II toxin-antitoxin system VapC family toxin [Variibacter sp.]
MIVLDASLTLGWLLREPELVAAGSVYRELPELQFLVSSHWSAEVANGLLVSIRRGRIAGDDVSLLLDLLSKFDIRPEPSLSLEAMQKIVRIGLEHNLTAYDAAYVGLADVKRAALATLDKAMRRAADRLGIRLVPT